jgi:hypothetical protein
MSPWLAGWCRGLGSPPTITVLCLRKAQLCSAYLDMAYLLLTHEPLARWLVPRFGIPSHNYGTVTVLYNNKVKASPAPRCDALDRAFLACDDASFQLVAFISDIRLTICC